MPDQVDVKVVNVEALTVQPDELLVLRWSSEVLPDNDAEFEQMMDTMHRALDETGFEGRYIIFVGDVEIAKVKR